MAVDRFASPDRLNSGHVRNDAQTETLRLSSLSQHFGNMSFGGAKSAKPGVAPGATAPSSIVGSRKSDVQGASIATQQVSVQTVRRLNLSALNRSASMRGTLSSLMNRGAMARQGQAASNAKNVNVAQFRDETGDTTDGAVDAGSVQGEIQRIIRLPAGKRLSGLVQLLSRFNQFSPSEKIMVHAYASGTLRQLPVSQRPQLLGSVLSVLPSLPKSVRNMAWADGVGKADQMSPPQRDSDIMVPLVNQLPEATAARLQETAGKVYEMVKAAPAHYAGQLRSTVSSVLPKLPPVMQLLVRSTGILA